MTTESSTTSTMPGITEQAQGLALVLAAARKHGLAEPLSILLGDRGVELHIYDLENFRAWACWADAPVTEGDPKEASWEPGRWHVQHKAEGAIYDLPVSLTTVEVGYMVEPTSWSCDTCGAAGGSTGGFVADGEDSGAFEHVCPVDEDPHAWPASAGCAIGGEL